MTGDYALSGTEKRLARWYVGTGFAHLAIGVLLGLLQVLQYAGLDLYPYVPGLRHYYQGLSIHGVFNALIFTTFFITGFLGFATSYSLKRSLHSLRLAWGTFWVMIVGLIMVDWALLTNRASVLYTSYAPLQAHPAYYMGLVLIVVGTWMLLLNMSLTYLDWRRENRGQRTPLIAFGALATMSMWVLSSVGIAAQFLFFMIPWALGWVKGTDPLLTRTLFWLTGHPLVYYWLLPAYVSWYFMLPRQVGGKLFSEPLARLAFLLFIPLSLPVGFHHQFLDPGVSQGSKAIHAFLTFAVFMPSAMTAFTVLASIESGGRARGGRGLFGWIRSLPWSDPSVTAQILAMLLFAVGGVSGLVNGSYTVNLVVHNTLFIPGHFHLTVGTATALTFMGIAYWFVPHLTGRRLWSRKIGLWQAWLWFAGMTIMSRGLTLAGILGAPRRTALGSAPYTLPEWGLPFMLAAVGGVMLVVSAVLFYYNLISTVWRSPRTEEVAPVPMAEALGEEGRVPFLLDRFVPWLVTAALLVVVTYGPTLARLLSDMRLDSPGVLPY